MSAGGKRKYPDTREEPIFPAASNPKRQKKPSKPRAPTPLQKFRVQTIQKRKELKEARKKIDKDLKAIERDLGVLKKGPRKPKAPRPS